MEEYEMLANGALEYGEGTIAFFHQLGLWQHANYLETVLKLITFDTIESINPNYPPIVDMLNRIADMRPV